MCDGPKYYQFLPFYVPVMSSNLNTSCQTHEDFNAAYQLKKNDSRKPKETNSEPGNAKQRTVETLCRETGSICRQHNKEKTKTQGNEGSGIR